MNLYVGNIAFETSEDQLKAAFGAFGEVTSVKIIMDRETGRSRGFGFVEMTDGGETAINEMNGKELNGRNLRVNEAKERTNTRSGGSGGRGRY